MLLLFLCWLLFCLEVIIGNIFVIIVGKFLKSWLWNLIFLFWKRKIEKINFKKYRLKMKRRNLFLVCLFLFVLLFSVVRVDMLMVKSFFMNKEV